MPLTVVQVDPSDHGRGFNPNSPVCLYSSGGVFAHLVCGVEQAPALQVVFVNSSAWQWWKVHGLSSGAWRLWFAAETEFSFCHSHNAPTARTVSHANPLADCVLPLKLIRLRALSNQPQHFATCQCVAHS
jgi:hypothetical protein